MFEHDSKYVKFFLLFVVWTLYNLCILYVKLFFVLSFQYFEKAFVRGFVVLFLCCFCFVVAAFICMFCSFMTYSTSYCCHYELKDPRCVCVCVRERARARTYVREGGITSGALPPVHELFKQPYYVIKYLEGTQKNRRF
jgi:ABC-type transport system involved in multi-copper enzyme maturation permease subunit